MKLDQSRPIFQQLARELCRRIARGELVPGERLPTVREMALQMTVNPNTVQRACQELEREGILTSRRGLGIFVSEAPGLLERLGAEMAAEAMDTCLAELQALGMKEEQMLDLFRQRLHARTGGAGH